MVTESIGSRGCSCLPLVEAGSGIAADLRAHPVCEVPPFNPVYTEVTIAIRGCSGLVLRSGGGENPSRSNDHEPNRSRHS